MQPTKLFAAFALFANHCCLSAQAQQLPPGMTIGNDGPAEEETRGFWTNHIGLNVRNLTASKAFYGDVLGMRHMFTIQYAPSYSLTYMGFSQGGKNHSGFQTGAELVRHKNSSGGLIKLLYFNRTEDPLIPSTAQTTTFANIGLVVPDIRAAEERLSRHGVPIVKRVGSVDVATDGPIAIAFNIGPLSTSDTTEGEELIKGLMTTDLDNIVFAEDPDGNMLEIVEQNGF